MDSFAEMTTIALGWITIWNAKKLEILTGASILAGLVVKNLSENAVAMMALNGTMTSWNAKLGAGVEIGAEEQDILEWALLDLLFSYSSLPAVVVEFAVLPLKNS